MVSPRLRRKDALVVGAVALAARLAVVAWAAGRFGPAGDGVYYDRIAHRIAEGHGYTWLWPDGAVTYAAHYPVGYPAIVAVFYFLFGGGTGVAMIANALLGTAGAVAAHRMLSGGTRSRALAIAGGLAVGLHPALVPYTVAVMTEGAVASLLCCAGACAEIARESARRWPWIVALGLAMGVATLVRPQSIALAPVLGWLALREGSLRERAKTALMVGAVAAACCLPWTARNCARMEKCAFVSANGGWNLLIGAQTDNGSWHEVDVPDACKSVWGEAEKDACFGRAAVAQIEAHPIAWLARAPQKLSMTFDYLGGAPWYLNASNPAVFTERNKLTLAVVETVAARLLLVGALVAAARASGPRSRARKILAGVGAVFALGLWAWPGYLALSVSVLLLGRSRLERAPVLLGWTALGVLATAATHAVFFGAGRYGMVVAPLVAALGFYRSTNDDP